MDKRILTDSSIVEAVNESVDTNISATIVVGAIVLVIFIIALWDELRNSNGEQGSGSDGDSKRHKRKTILGMAAFFLLIVGMPILFRWNSYKKLSGDDWHMEETVVTKKVENKDYDTDTGTTYTYSIFVEGHSRAIADIPKSKYNSVSKGDEVYVVVDDSTGWIYDFYPMDSYIYNGE